MVQTKAPDNYSLKTGKKPSSITKPSTHNHNAKAGLSSPNYMKSTSCSEARKEKPISSASSSYDGSFHKVSSSSLKKVGISRKAPNSNPLKSVNECSTDTCSSILKYSKFPRFLVLNPGGTESEGASIEKVCPYNYCSLNKHKHNSNPPLKGFLSSRRRELRAQRNIMKPVTLCTRKGRPCKDDDEIKENVGVDLVAGNETDEAVTVFLGEEKADFVVEIYVKENKDKEKGVSDVGYEGGLIGGDFGWEKATSITALDELFAECSDAELEGEGRLYLSGLEISDGRSAPSEQESDYTFVDPLGDEIMCLLDEEGVKKDDVGIKFHKESLSEESHEFSRDEITDCHVHFSDSESTVNDVCEETEFDQFLQDYGCSDKKTFEASEIEDERIKDSPKRDDETISTVKISEESSIHEGATEFLCNDLRALDVLGHENAPMIDIETSGFTMQDSEDTKTSFNHEESNGCRSLKTMIRSKKQGENSEELKPFNPREPNYLEVEPEAEREKVDLRHLEMDERRNAEEWMFDYAVRRAVNQLAPARKRKVALLVEAFETVTPPTQSCDTHVRPNFSGS